MSDGAANRLQRREFLGSALAGMSLLLPSAQTLPGAQTSPRGDETLPPSPDEIAPAPEMTPNVTRRARRYESQRWLLDAVIATVGPEWDQHRYAGLLGATAGRAAEDVAGLRARVHKFRDITRETARAAIHREHAAQTYEAAGRRIPARENYYIAALLYSAAQWPIFEVTRENLALNDKKNACYAKYIEYSDHEIRRVEVPFAGKSLPGYLHLPPGVNGRAPCVWAISGMDSVKETSSALYGDELRERGIATLALEGPGQGECLLRGIYADAANWIEAGKAVLNWLRGQASIDPDRIALRCVSMGSFWGTQVASADSRLRGCVVHGMCVEPGDNTIFNTASPTFRLRFMFLTGYQDEAAFDRFISALSVRPIAPNVHVPYLAIVGQDDQLCPIEDGYALLALLGGPKQMMVYEGADHGVGGSTAVTMGPSPSTVASEWLADRFAGKPMPTEHSFVDVSGNVRIRSFAEASRALSYLG